MFVKSVVSKRNDKKKSKKIRVNVTHTTPAVPVSPSRASSVNAQSVQCDLNTRGSLRRKINMSVNFLKIHIPMNKQVGKRDWKGNRTKSLRNSSSVKDSIAVLIVMIERKFPLYFPLFSPRSAPGCWKSLAQLSSLEMNKTRIGSCKQVGANISREFDRKL